MPHKQDRIVGRGTSAGGTGWTNAATFDLNDATHRTVLLTTAAPLNDGYSYLDGVDYEGALHHFPDGDNWFNNATSNVTYTNATATNSGKGVNTDANAILLAGSMRLSGPVQYVGDPGVWNVRIPMGHATSTLTGLMAFAIFEGEAGYLRDRWGHYNMKSWTAGMTVNGGTVVVSSIDGSVWLNAQNSLTAGAGPEPSGSSATVSDGAVTWTRVNYPDGTQVYALLLARATFASTTPATVANMDGTFESVNTWGGSSEQITVGGAGRITIFPLGNGISVDIRSISIDYATPFTLEDLTFYDRLGYEKGLTPTAWARDPLGKPIGKLNRATGLPDFTLDGDLAPYVEVVPRGTEYWVYTANTLIPDAMASAPQSLIVTQTDAAASVTTHDTTLTFTVVSSQGKPASGIDSVIRTQTWLIKKKVKDQYDARGEIAPDDEEPDHVITVNSLGALGDALQAIPQPATGDKYQIECQDGTYAGALQTSVGGSVKDLDMGTGWLRITKAAGHNPALNFSFTTRQRNVRWTGLRLPNNPALRGGTIYTLTFGDPGRGGINGVAGRFNRVRVDHCHLGMAAADGYDPVLYAAMFNDRSTGDRVRISSSGAMPAPLVAGVDYYIVKIGPLDVKLATSLANALSNTTIDITSETGDGVSVTMTFQDISRSGLVRADQVGNRLIHDASNNANISVSHGELFEFTDNVLEANRAQINVTQCKLTVSGRNDTRWSRNDYLQTAAINTQTPSPAAWTYDVFGTNETYLMLFEDVSRHEIDFPNYSNAAHTDYWQVLRPLNSHDWKANSTSFASSNNLTTDNGVALGPFVYYTPDGEARVYKLISNVVGQAFGATPPTGLVPNVNEVNGNITIAYQYTIPTTENYVWMEKVDCHADGPQHFIAARQFVILSAVRRGQNYRIAAINNMQGGPTSIGFQIGEGELHIERHTGIGPANLGASQPMWAASTLSPAPGTLFCAEDANNSQIFEVIVQGVFGTTKPTNPGNGDVITNGSAVVLYVGGAGADRPKAYSQNSADIYVEDSVFAAPPESLTGRVFIGDNVTLMNYSDATADPNAVLGSGSDFELLGTGIYRNIWHYPDFVDDGVASRGAFSAAFRAIGAPLAPETAGIYTGDVTPPTAFTLAKNAGPHEVGTPITLYVELDQPATVQTTVTLGQAGVSGSFDDNTLVFEIGEIQKTAQFTPTTAGTAVFSADDNQSLTDPADVNATVNAAATPPTEIEVGASAFALVVGQTVRVTFTLDEEATEAVTITPVPSGVTTTLSAAMVVIPIGSTSGFVDVTATSAGTLQVTCTNNRGLANPAALAIGVSVASLNKGQLFKLLRRR